MVFPEIKTYYTSTPFELSLYFNFIINGAIILSTYIV